MTWIGPVTLSGRHVTLQPLAQSHLGELVEAVKDGEPWKLWYTHVPAPDGMAAEIENRLALQAQGACCPLRC